MINWPKSFKMGGGGGVPMGIFFKKNYFRIQNAAK